MDPNIYTALLFAILFSVCTRVIYAADYQGCYKESIRNRIFSISPGSYQPQLMTSDFCRGLCGLYEYTYAALADGKFCFCSQSLPGKISASINCDVPCAGNGSLFCGGLSYVSVYITKESLTGLEVTSNIASIESTPTTVDLVVNVTKGRNIQYYVNYDDGADLTSANETNLFSRKLYLPGQYSVLVRADDEFTKSHLAAVSFQLEEPVQDKDLELQCQPVFATHSEGQCEMTIWRGSNLVSFHASVTQKPAYSIAIDHIADPALSMIGTWKSTTSNANLKDNQVILIQNAVFPNTGKVYGFRINVEQNGMIDILVLSCKPSCKQETTKCTSPTDAFCMQEHVCTGACYNSSRNSGGQYTVKYRIPVNLNSMASFWHNQTPALNVSSGDILGIHHTSSGGLISSTNSGEQDILLAYANPTEGVTFDTSTGSNTAKHYSLQALYSAGSKVLLKYMFDGETGRFLVKVNVTNKHLNLSANAETYIKLMEGVNFTIIEGPQYVPTDEAVSFTLMEHTGGNLTYDWNITDGSPQSHLNKLTHTFTAPGEYNISVAIYNVFSRKENFTIVHVEDKIKDLKVSVPNSETKKPTTISLTLTSGSNYTCTLKYGDGSTLSIADPTQIIVPSSTSTHSHTYVFCGIFTVTIACSNHVNNETATTRVYVEEAIVNLRLEIEGADVDTPFRIKWLVDAGSNLNFTLTLDGAAVSVQGAVSVDLFFYKWQSVEIPAKKYGKYPLVLLANNRVSHAKVTCDYIILDRIINPSITSDLVNVTIDDNVTVTLNMDQGSDVTVTVQWQDGSPDHNISTNGYAWSGPINVTHKFINGCNCKVTMIASNAQGSYTRTVEILVRVDFSAISWNMPDSAYYLFEPPAYIYFEFNSSTRVLSTDPTITVDWADGTSDVSHSFIFGSPGYSHTYDDPGRYPLTININSIVSSRIFAHYAVVVEKLVGPKIILPFDNAPLNQTYNVGFELYRGDQGILTNLTWDFGDGILVTTERQGTGINGKDIQNVTYTTEGWKNITVTATAPPNQVVTASRLVEVVEPILESALNITTNEIVQKEEEVTFTIQYNSANIPPNTTIYIYPYGNDTVIGPLTFSSKGTQSSIFTYSTDGQFNATIIVENSCSKVVKNVSVGVFNSFDHLQAAITFVPDTKTAKPVNQNGLNNSGGLLYPLDSPVMFTVSDANKAFATVYKIQSIAGPANVLHESTSNSSQILFPVDGTYTLNITASNPLHTATIKQTITLVRRVAGLNITSEAIAVAPGQSKYLNISFTDYGNDTCVYIYWHDVNDTTYGYCSDGFNCSDSKVYRKGNMHDLTTKLIGHNYREEGEYTATVKAVNAYGSETSSLHFTISYLNCTNPSVSIDFGETLYYNAPKYSRSDIIRIRGLAKLNCPDIIQNTKSWTIDAVDKSTGLNISSIDVSSLVTYKAELYIPARNLTLGLYKATFKMALMNSRDNLTFVSEAYTYFQVTNSFLLGIMIDGMTEVTRGSAQRLILDPLILSRDPDLEVTADQGLRVDSWSCTVVSPANVSQDTCNQVATQSQKLDIAVSSLVQGYIYKIAAALSKGTREVSTEVLVFVNGTSPPIGRISCLNGSVCYPRSDGYMVLQSSQLSLRCECLNCSPSATYKWSIHIKDYRWNGGWRPLKDAEILAASISSDETRSQDFALQPRIFASYVKRSEVMKAQCNITVGAQNAAVSTWVHINKPPTGGTCTITPKKITATVTADQLWRIECSGWTDPDGIKEFQFYSKFDQEQIVREITSVPTTNGSLNITVCLPIGPAYNNFQQKVFVAVRDIYNTDNQTFIDEVQVLSPPEMDLRKYIDRFLDSKTNHLFKVFQEGDQRDSCELATAFMTSINMDAMNSNKEYINYEVPSQMIGTGYGPSGENRPSAYKEVANNQSEEIQYEYDKRRNDIAKLKTDLVKHILNLSFEDILSVQQVAALFAETSSQMTDLTANGQDLMIQGLETMVNNLLDPNKMPNIPKEDIERAMNSIYSTLGCLMEASGSNGRYPTLEEMDETRKEGVWNIYDTSIETLGDKTDVSSARSEDEANKLHTRKVHLNVYAKHAQAMAKKTADLNVKMVELFNRYTVSGQVQETTTNRLKYRVEKNALHKILGKTLEANGSRGEIRLPDRLNMNQDNIVTFQIIQSTNSPNSYLEKELQGIFTYTHFVSADFFDENGDKLTVEETTDPIRIVIPHDKNVPAIAKKSVRPLVTKWNLFQLHQTETKSLSSSIHLQFEVDETVQLIVVAKYNDIPNASNTDFTFLVPPTLPPEPDSKYPYTIVLSDKDPAYKAGKWWFGTREREKQYINKPLNNSELVKGSGAFEHDYNLTIWSTGCYHQTGPTANWNTTGCQVTRDSTLEATVCECNHLTTFAGGLIVSPNIIDWNFAFSHADFLSNPTLYITEIFIAIIFIMAFFLARRKDKHDIKLLGIAPLVDNEPKDKYYYEVIVSTGMRRNAATESRVFFIMSGENDETEIRMFSDKRPIFKRGMKNGFLMAVPECLGRINYMRVWHDNSGKGKFGSWFLNYIIVKDLQKDTKQMFIANRWFAVEEDDGMVDRIIPLAGKEQLEEFGYQFKERSKKNLADGHLWFSVVARPPGSRFTCVQRVACCLCLLFMTMLTNAMFYQTEGNEENSASTSFTFGPFALSISQIFIGFISTVIVFPVNFLLVFLFRTSQPRQNKSSNTMLACNDGKQKPIKLSQVNPQVVIGSQVSLDRGGVANRGSSPGPFRDTNRLVDDSDSRSATPANTSSSLDLLQPDRPKKKRQLPWWCVIVAWVLLISCTLMSAVLVTFYGISFEDHTCKKWITSLIISFFTSVFITQPLKVILTAVFLSIIIKSPGEDEEEEEIDEEKYPSDPDNDLLHQPNDPNVAATKPKKVGYKPPNRKELEKLRAQRLKEVKMWTVIREIIFYSLFIWIILIISHSNRSPDNFRYKDNMYETFINVGDPEKGYDNITNTKEYWEWVQEVFLEGIMARKYYNDEPPLRLRGYINDKASRILGHATLRQLRVKPGQCQVPPIFQHLISQCNSLYSLLSQDERDYDVGWILRTPNSSNTKRTEYLWSPATLLNGHPYWGILAIYSGGGYVAHLNGTNDEVKNILQKLENESWIDRYTRVVFIEFTVYNPQVNLFSINTLLAEFHSSNGVVPSYRFEPAMLLPYMTDSTIFEIVCEIVFIVFIIIHTVLEIIRFCKLRWQYFADFWSWVEMSIISLSIACIFTFLYRLIETNSLTRQIKNGNGNGYVKFQYVGYWNEMLSYMSGFTVFLATIKFIRLLRFNKRISMLGSTLDNSAKHLLHFGIIFTIIFMAFCQLFFLTFMNTDEKYATIIASITSSVLMLMGKFTMFEMNMAAPILSQVYILMYVIVVTFVVINMFISILTDTFASVREDIQKQSNDYEIIEFMLSRLQKWTGLRVVSANTPLDPNARGPQDIDEDNNDDNDNTDKIEEDAENPNMAAFPSRIDKLLQSLSQIYRDSGSGNLISNGSSPFTKAPYRAPPRDSLPALPRPRSTADKRPASLAKVDT